MRFTEAKGRKIVSTSTAATVGKVSDFVVDPDRSSVVALRLKASGGEVLRWSDLSAFGTDAVTVSGPDKITDTTDDLARLTGRDHKIIGKRVLTVDGEELGQATDVIFDEQTGQVTAVVFADGNSASGRVVGIGSYAVVIELD